MDHRTGLLLAWLEGEGERRRRPTPLPARVGDPAVRGWVHVGVCGLAGILTLGLFACWLAKAWHLGAGTGWLSGRDFRAVTVQGVRVEGITRAPRPGGRPGPLTLTVSGGSLWMACEFRREKAPQDVRVGDTVSIRSAAGRAEGAGRVLLQDCEVVEGPRRPRE